jgi:hypothetical protein
VLVCSPSCVSPCPTNALWVRHLHVLTFCERRDRGLVIIAKDGKGVMGELNNMAIDKTWCRQLEYELWLVVWEEEV